MTEFAGDPWPFTPWQQPMYYSGPVPDWIIRRCLDCDLEFPVHPIEGEPLADKCNPCLRKMADEL